MTTFLDTASLAEMLVIVAGLSFFGCVGLLALVSWAGRLLRRRSREMDSINETWLKGGTWR